MYLYHSVQALTTTIFRNVQAGISYYCKSIKIKVGAGWSEENLILPVFCYMSPQNSQNSVSKGRIMCKCFGSVSVLET